MAYSTQETTSDGSLVELDLTLEYFDRSEIAVLFDGVVDDLPWAWVGTTENTIEFDPAIPIDVVVQVRRSTDLAAARHQFSQGAAVTAQSMDETILQVLHIAQEAREGSGLGDIYQDLNAHGYRVVNVGDPVDAGDAMNKGSATTVIQGLIATELADIATAVTDAETAAASADVSADAAAASAVLADDSADAAAASAITAAASAITAAASNHAVQNFRLTLTSGVPVTTSDVVGATTLYCTPYIGEYIGLYNGSTWDVLSSAEFSVALGTVIDDRPYDAYVYNNAGTPTLEITAWSSASARATALAYQDGVLVKSGTPTRRYLGTFCTTSTTTVEDSVTTRYLHNYYNQVDKDVYCTDSVSTYVYTTATWRQANANTANKVRTVTGLAENCFNLSVTATCTSAGGGGVAVAVGVDSTTVPAGQFALWRADSHGSGVHAQYNRIPSIGRHVYNWLEFSLATGTTTWYGTPSGFVPGLHGSFKC